MTHEETIKRIQELTGGMALELHKDWEKSFYESGWTPDSINYTKEEKIFVEEMGTFLPRHMDVYDWNLPYIDFIVLSIRRNFSQPITLAVVLMAMWKTGSSGNIELDRSALIPCVNFTATSGIKRWDLSKDNFNDQSEETKSFIGGLLDNKD